MTTLANFDVDAFLRDHWQQRPLLVRKAFAPWHNPIAPDELAGLACEEGSEARLIARRRKGWRVAHGPFDDKDFARLAPRDWTLLVQAVDHVVPAVAALIEPFRFLPDWRIDDVMVSYATDGGGVGPHFDQYDVFLVQGLGQRRWRIGGACDADTPLLPHDDLRLLAHFQATDEWILDPGDMLYLPPGIAHDGVAVGDDCMTYSIGFRAPARSELIAHFVDDMLERLGDDDRYADAGLRRQANPGVIDDAALTRLHAMVTETLGDRAAFARWFGRYTTTPKDADAVMPDEGIDADAVRAAIVRGAPIVRNPASRFAFVERGHEGGDEAVTLFVDGTALDCTGPDTAFARTLCAMPRVDALPADAPIDLLVTLFRQGSVGFKEAED